MKTLFSTLFVSLLALPAIPACVAAESATPDHPTALPFIFNMIHDNPGEKPFDTKYRDPVVLKSMGNNGQVIKSFQPPRSLGNHFHIPQLMPYQA